MPDKKVTVSIFLVLSLAAGFFFWGGVQTEKPFKGARIFFQDIRHALQYQQEVFAARSPLPKDFRDGESHLYLTLFQPGLKPVRWGTNRSDLTRSLKRIISKIKMRPGFKKYDLANPQKTRLLLEYITQRRPVPNINLLSTSRLDQYRFEPGVTGLRFSYRKQTYYYMPTEAFTRSHMSVNQTFAYLGKRVGVKAKSRAERIRKFKDRISNIELIESRAFVTHQNDVIELYRGYPTPLANDPQDIKEGLFTSVNWLLNNMSKKGRFLYYYDAATDDEADYQHPKNPRYYNILRHSGGTITLLRAYEVSGEVKYLDAARNSLHYLLSKSRRYEKDGLQNRYVFYNKKAKLGGSGIALAALMHYYRLSGDDSFLPQSAEISRHLTAQITPDGEFTGYYIHPRYNDGKPLVDITEATRKKLFSFYYPGEALLGMALYEKYAPLSDEARAALRADGIRALDFLIHVRPRKYPELFLPLPADSWLMQAIEEWWDHPDMQKPAYADFVFGDAAKMIDHMYGPQNSPYPDYTGHFYYNYGEHALPDGSRAEGLIAAYYLARKMGKNDLAAHYLDKNILVAKALMQTYNSPLSVYATPNPEKSAGSFRFKLTRQWIRVDSIQHTACFLARLYPEL